MKESSAALVLTCCESGFFPEQLFTTHAAVLQNLGGFAHQFEAAQISLAVHQARSQHRPLDVVVLTHHNCSFLGGREPLDHALSQLQWLSRHPMLASSPMHACHLDPQGHLMVGDLEHLHWVSPLSLVHSGEVGWHPRLAAPFKPAPASPSGRDSPR